MCRRGALYWTATSILPVSLKCHQLCEYPVCRRVCTVFNSELSFPSIWSSLPQCVLSAQEDVYCIHQQVLFPKCLCPKCSQSVYTQSAGECVLYLTVSSHSPVYEVPYLSVYPVHRRKCTASSISQMSLSKVFSPLCILSLQEGVYCINSKFYFTSVSEWSLPLCVLSEQEGVQCIGQQILFYQCLWSFLTSVYTQCTEGCVLHWTASSFLSVSLKCPYLCVYPLCRRVCNVLNSKFYFTSVSDMSLPHCVASVQEDVYCIEQQVLFYQCLQNVFTVLCTRCTGGCVLYWTASSISMMSLKCRYPGVYPVGRRVCAVLNSKFYYPSVSEVSAPWNKGHSDLQIVWGHWQCNIEVSLPWCVSSGQEGVCCIEQQVLLPQCLWSVHTLVCTQWAGGGVLYWTASSITPVSLRCSYLSVYP